MAMMYQFFINELFGSVWFALAMIGMLFSIIGVLGRMGVFLMLSLLALYFITMAVLFGGLIVWVLGAIVIAGYWGIQITRPWD